MTAPLILDFDDSVLEVAKDELRLPLQDWQERLRFGCTRRRFADFRRQLRLPEKHGAVFLGSGDYHHVSLLLLERFAAAGKKVVVVVCDNHPDNMRYLFGIHCGSWVFHASRLPFVSHIHVIGITSDDVTAKHALENHLSPLVSGKLSYWSVGKKTGWLNAVGAKKARHDFDTADALLDAFRDCLAPSENIYLSIDKDVFGKDVVETNWDQGCFTFGHIQSLAEACRRKLVGVDVTGEISGYAYRSRFKRLLAMCDGLAAPEASALRKQQEKQQRLNKQLMELF